MEHDPVRLNFRLAAETPPQRLRAAGIVERIRAELGDEAAPVIGTGGLAELIAPHAKTIEKVDPYLTLEGLRLVWELNQPE